MKHVLLAILFGVAVVASAQIHAAQQPRRTGDPVPKVARTLLVKSVEARLADRRSKCMNAVGSPAFCDCLNGLLPIAATFAFYIEVTTAARKEYAQLTPDDKKMADLIIATRDQCVAKVFATAK